MKWYSTEKEQGAVTYQQADELIAFSQTHGIPVRGHCLFWSKDKFNEPWVQKLSRDELRAAVEQRLESIIPHFGNQVTCWDVINEMLDGDFFGRHDLRSHIFKKAAVLHAPPLFINEYGIIGSPEKQDRLLTLMTELASDGAPIGGIGIQEHACERFTTALGLAHDTENPEREHAYPVTPEQMWDDLNRLGEATKLPIHLTEVSCKHPDPEVRAPGIETVLRVAFANPHVESFLLWGFWKKANWLKNEACLIDADRNVNAAG